MPFHVSMFGAFGRDLPCDLDGSIPAPGDGPFDLNFLHPEPTHDADGRRTAYGLWWEEEAWPMVQDRASAAILGARERLEEWRRRRPRR